MARVPPAAVTMLFAVLTLFTPALQSMPDDPDTLREVTVGTWFSVLAPPGSHVEMTKGVDSGTGRIVTPRFTLTFDYGLYGDPLDADTADTNYHATEAQIDGHSARIMSAFAPHRSADHPYFSGVHFPDLGRTGRGPLTLTVTSNLKTGDDLALAEKIYRSIRIKVSVTKATP